MHSKWIAVQQMRCNGKRDDFSLKDLLLCAQKGDIKNPMEIIREVSEGIDSWFDCAKKAEFPELQAKRIQNLFRNEIINELKN